ncbi:unnamed protein product, partial [Brassica oleracea var. botrytis]
MDCWEVTEASEEVAAEASEEVTTTIADAMREGFGTCLKEINITTKRKGTSSQNTTSPPKPTLEPGVKHVCFVYSVWILYIESVNGTNAGRKSLAEDKGPDKEDAGYQEKRDAALALCRAKSYNPFAPIDKKKLKELADWLKTYPRLTNNSSGKSYDANPQNFRSERMCFLVHLFAQQWRFNFKDFKDSEPDQNVLGRRLPGGAICSSISPEELDVVMEPFLYMVPYLLVECAYSDEQRVQYNLEPFTYERPANIPPARAGDCGVYTLKYIECHALGI